MTWPEVAQKALGTLEVLACMGLVAWWMWIRRDKR